MLYICFISLTWVQFTDWSSFRQRYTPSILAGTLPGSIRNGKLKFYPPTPSWRLISNKAKPYHLYFSGGIFPLCNLELPYFSAPFLFLPFCMVVFYRFVSCVTTEVIDLTITDNLSDPEKEDDKLKEVRNEKEEEKEENSEHKEGSGLSLESTSGLVYSNQVNSGDCTVYTIK